MGTIKIFEELEVWKMARELINLIYSDFRDSRDFAFKDQITRAGISIMNNVSVGFCGNISNQKSLSTEEIKTTSYEQYW